MKKAVSLMMAAAMTMGLAACGSTASTDTAASAADTASSTELLQALLTAPPLRMQGL